MEKQNSWHPSIKADTGWHRLWGKLPALLLIALTSSTVAGDVSLFGGEQFAGKKGVTVTVGAPYIDMHTGPGRGYPVFHVAEKHEALRLLKSRTDWYKVVTTNGEMGWVPHAKLKNAITDGVGPQASHSQDPTK